MTTQPLTNITRPDELISIIDGYLMTLTHVHSAVTGRSNMPKFDIRIVENISTDETIERNPDMPDIVDGLSLVEYLGIPSSFAKRVWYMAMKSSLFYNTFWIDKGSGEVVTQFDPNRKLREINAPKPTLKRLQRAIADLLLSKLPKHDANYAYMSGRSIKDACDNQVNYDVTIGVDLHDFFGSHTTGYVIRKLEEYTGYPTKVCILLAKLCTLDGKMPQGAPTSPILSIVLNYGMDVKIKRLADEHGLTYTRYADDLHFSGNERPNTECYRFVKELSFALKPFVLNDTKTRIMREHTYTYTRGLSCKFNGGSIESFSTAMTEAGSTLPEDKYRFELNGDCLRVLFRSKEDILCTNKAAIDACRSTLERIGCENIEIIPWYEQSIRRMLGLNLSSVVSYPRVKYEKLRLEAMLFGKGAHNNKSYFKGIMAYVKMVDPHKYAKLEAIVEKYRIRRGASV